MNPLRMRNITSYIRRLSDVAILETSLNVLLQPAVSRQVNVYMHSNEMKNKNVYEPSEYNVPELHSLVQRILMRCKRGATVCWRRKRPHNIKWWFCLCVTCYRWRNMNFSSDSLVIYFRNVKIFVHLQVIKLQPSSFRSIGGKGGDLIIIFQSSETLTFHYSLIMVINEHHRNLFL